MVQCQFQLTEVAAAAAVAALPVQMRSIEEKSSEPEPYSEPNP